MQIKAEIVSGQNRMSAYVLELDCKLKTGILIEK